MTALLQQETPLSTKGAIARFRLRDMLHCDWDKMAKYFTNKLQNTHSIRKQLNILEKTGLVNVSGVDC